MFVAIMIVITLVLGFRLYAMASCVGIALILLNEERLERFFDTAAASLK